MTGFEEATSAFDPLKIHKCKLYTMHMHLWLMFYMHKHLPDVEEWEIYAL